MIKKLHLIFSLIIFSAPILSAQEDPLEKIVQLASEKAKLEVEIAHIKKDRDSLQKLLSINKKITDDENEIIARLNDEKIVLEKENSKFKNDLQNRSDDFKKLQKEVMALRQDSIKTQKFRQQKTDFEKELKKKDEVIESLNSEILQKNQVIKKIKDEEKIATGEATKSAVREISNFYTREFDALISASNKGSLERDRDFIKKHEKNMEDKSVLATLNYLITFFESQDLLAQSFDKSSINSALSKLRESSPDSKKWKNLIKTLESYENQTNALKEALEAIKKIDIEMVANNPQTRKMKEEMILPKLSDFIFNYDFNYQAYPFLTSTIMDVIKVKRGNPNSDISEIIKKLN